MRPSRWRRVARATTCAVAAVVALETLEWAQALAYLGHVATFPQPALLTTGDVRLWTAHRPDPSTDAWETVITDVDRRVLETVPGIGVPRAVASWEPSDVLSRASPFGALDGGIDRRLEDLLHPTTWADRIVIALNSHWIWTAHRGLWEFDGRWFLRRLGRDVVAGFGPDGELEDPRTPAGDTFDPERFVLAEDVFGSGSATRISLLDRRRRDVVVVVVERVPDPDDPRSREKYTERITVTRHSVAAAQDGSPEPVEGVADRRTGFHSNWMSTAPVFTRLGGDLVVTRPNTAASAVFPIRRDAVTMARTQGTPEALLLLRAPIRGAGIDAGMLWLPADRAPVEADVTLAPTTAAERATAVAVGVTSLLRPPVLNVVSFVLPPPRGAREFFSRWGLDEFVAGGAAVPWLLGSLAVGALCAWLAHRWIGVRVAARRSARLWTATAFAFGPLGLLWMRLVVPARHVGTCTCGRRRAVDVELCPACGAGWPAPVPQGNEVFP